MELMLLRVETKGVSVGLDEERKKKEAAGWFGNKI
jgi:hypothetical protein